MALGDEQILNHLAAGVIVRSAAIADRQYSTAGNDRLMVGVGLGHGEWEVGSGKWGVGSGKWGVGSGKWGVGVLSLREKAMGGLVGG